MFSNSINSSLIRFARPNRVREEEASWSMTTMAGELELDRTEHVRSQSRFSLRGIDHPVGSCSSHLQPRDTTRVHDLSPFVRDQRERENPSAFHVNLDSDLEAVWSLISRFCEASNHRSIDRDETFQRRGERLSGLRCVRRVYRDHSNGHSGTDGTDSTGSQQARRIPRKSGVLVASSSFFNDTAHLSQALWRTASEYQLCPS
ncbi:hypothetical protein HN011_004472 [Eciton burchellii]|nr:hypothetical protein HN011_004472 [Eciton burchellii]